jgi:hypothetical protein
MKSDEVGEPDLIIPVQAAASKEPFEMYLKHALPSIRKRFGYTAKSKSKLIPTVRAHPVDVTFAITYNKVQGMTLDRLILVLHDLNASRLGKMSVQKLYVALSRVKLGKHIAIWPADHGQLKYLYRKKNSARLQAWNAHYDNNGHWKASVPVVLSKVSALFDTFKGVLANARVKDLKDVCRELGVYFSKKKTTLNKLRVAVTPAWELYQLRQQQ